MLKVDQVAIQKGSPAVVSVKEKKTDYLEGRTGINRKYGKMTNWREMFLQVYLRL